MSEDHICDFVVNRNEPETWGGDEVDDCYIREEDIDSDGFWECPFHRYNNSQYCVFHSNPEVTDSQDLKDKLTEVIADAEDRVQILSGTFGSLDLSDIQIGREGLTLVLSHSNFEGDVTFLNSFIHFEAVFEGCVFKGSCNFSKCQFHRDVFFSGSVFLERTFLFNAEFHERVFFNKVDFKKKPMLRGIDFYDDAYFEGANLQGAILDETDLTAVNFTGANLQMANLNQALLSRASLIGADLRGARLSGAVLTDARIDESTQFLGDAEEEDHVPYSFNEIFVQKKSVHDPDYEGPISPDGTVGSGEDVQSISKAKSVYKQLEGLARNAARNSLLRQAFVRRQDIQRKRYWQVFSNAPKFEQRLIAGARFARASVSRITLLYGESPWRVVGISSLFVLVIGLLYPLFGWLQPREVGVDPITWTRILDGEPHLLLESIYFSALTFTTLGMGDYEPVGGGGQLLATFNTVIGAMLIALLVFVFGRRASR